MFTGVAGTTLNSANSKKIKMRLHKARGPPELGKVTPGSATQGLWLEDGKVGSQVIGVDRSPLTGRGTVGKLGEEEDEPATERRRK